MTTKKPKQSAPALVEIYCIVSNATTSKGRACHGDTAAVPEAEAEVLKAKGDFK